MKATGDGRVYHIGFTATDDYGASCSGEVKVGVPLSRAKRQPLDGGALYDSTAVFAAAFEADPPAGEEITIELYLPLVNR